MKRTLPPRVYAHHGSYFLVVADGAKRIWRPLCRIDEGLPAMYAALAQMSAADVAQDRMPAVVAAWRRDVMARHAPKTQRDETARGRVIAESFAEFTAAQVRAPDVVEFLRPLQDRPRTHNLYRAQLRELMRYAIERGWRDDNPVEHLHTLPTPARTRYITDSEMRRIKVGGIYGDDGTRTRSGRMLAALIDVAYLSGQRIGDLLELRWRRDDTDPDAPHVADDGLHFRPAKTRSRTGAAVVIDWTPRLLDAFERLRMMRGERRAFCGWVFVTIAGRRYTYSGAISAWTRAVRRAGVADVTFHDLRAKALSDKERAEGMQAARTMGSHSTEQQTSAYVRARLARHTKATR